MIIHKQYGEPLDPSQGPKGTKWILIMSAAKRLYAGKVTFLLLQGLWTCISAETISYVSFCYIKFSTTKSICTTWFIHPEIERCISAFQLFSRRQYHSCWKIYSRTWSCQVFLSNHTTLNVRIRLQYFTFYEFLWCYCLIPFLMMSKKLSWCPGMDELFIVHGLQLILFCCVGSRNGRQLIYLLTCYYASDRI